MLFTNARRSNYTVCAQENLWVAKDTHIILCTYTKDVEKERKKVDQHTQIARREAAKFKTPNEIVGNV